jgi:hypothetical protein
MRSVSHPPSAINDGRREALFERHGRPVMAQVMEVEVAEAGAPRGLPKKAANFGS